MALHNSGHLFGRKCGRKNGAGIDELYYPGAAAVLAVDMEGHPEAEDRHIRLRARGEADEANELLDRSPELALAEAQPGRGHGGVPTRDAGGEGTVVVLAQRWKVIAPEKRKYFAGFLGQRAHPPRLAPRRFTLGPCRRGGSIRRGFRSGNRALRETVKGFLTSHEGARPHQPQRAAAATAARFARGVAGGIEQPAVRKN